ncbi:unnamed protein product, partial [Scytosiphon promiscuus]
MLLLASPECTSSKMASRRSLLLATVSCSLLLGCASGQSMEIGETTCDFDTFSSLRSIWSSDDEPCQQKLSFGLWTKMKAEGSSPDEDAQHVQANCLQSYEPHMLEMTFREATEGFDVRAPGTVAAESPTAVSYVGWTASTLEAICDDGNIVNVVPVEALVDSGLRRRLQSTTSEAGQAHQVPELIAGLEELGCSSTKGEGQTLCVMSDSFNSLGNAAGLQASGDLPPVDIIRDLPADQGSDEGSAMIELTYDIAPGATYKFNSAFFGPQEFGTDIGILAGQESCDVIVDDVGNWIEPSFRDGVVASAVDDAVNDEDILYFSSAGNSNPGKRIDSAEFTCDVEFGLCDAFQGPTLVVHPDLPTTDLSRYFWPMQTSASSNRILMAVNWDADIPTDDDIGIAVFRLSGTVLNFQFIADNLHDTPTEVYLHTATPNADGYYMAVVQLGLEDRTSEANYIQADFHLTSSTGFAEGSDGSIFGHPCASKAIGVAAMDWEEGDGPNGEFEDPETSVVEVFSSRGPCLVEGDTREKPDTCAADGLSTSSPGFQSFFGTSAAAPVAAAIATIVRGACHPKVVGYADLMEMLTDYEYTIDYTNDGAAEAWGPEAGHGIISAAQMLAWVKANCAASCPGAEVTCGTDYPCPGATDTVLPDAVCSSGTCTDEECCEPEVTCGADYPCPGATDTVLPDAVCSSGTCTDEECCEP